VRRFFYGWVIVGAAFLALFIYGVQYTFGIFMGPLVSEFGWSRPAISHGVAIPLVVFWGRFLDKYGPRRLFAIVCFVGGLGLFLAGFTSELWHLYLTFGFLWGISSSALFIIPAVVRRWFDRRAGLALGIAMCGVALSWPVLFPLTAHFIASAGWAHAFRFLAVLVWVAGIIIVALMKPSPEAIGSVPDGESPHISPSEKDASIVGGWEVGAAIKTRSFWMVWLTLFCLITALTMTIYHGPSYAKGQGLPGTEVAFVFGMMGLISVLGRIGSGRLGDYLAMRGMHPVHARRYMYCLSGILMGSGAVLLLQVVSLSWLWIWAIVFGIGYGCHTPQLGAILGDLFGRKNIGFILSLGGTAAGVAGVIGPILAGLIYDLTLDYARAFQVAAVLSFFSILFAMLAKPEKQAPAKVSDQVAGR